MAVAWPARLLVGHRLVLVPEVALLTVVAVPARRVMAALVADPAGYPAGQAVELHVEPAAAGVEVAGAGHALVGGRGGGPPPRAVKVEGFTLFTLPAVCVVLTITGQLAVFIKFALRGVTIAFTAAAYGQV